MSSAKKVLKQKKQKESALLKYAGKNRIRTKEEKEELVIKLKKGLKRPDEATIQSEE